MRVLVEQRTFSHHLDRPGPARIEHETEATFEQIVDAAVCEKTLLLASGKAEQFFRLAEPPGDFRMLP